MWTKRFSCVMFSLLILSQTSLADITSQSNAISKEKIGKATWMMYAWKVLGWQYDSPYWTKGSEEKGEVGQRRQSDPSNNVRAICLGLEGDHYVFFTLRAFVDPAFPNLLIQEVKGIPLDRDQKPFSEKEIKTESYIRYGEISLVQYEDVGSLHKIVNNVSVVTHCDQENPKAYGRYPGSSYLPGYREVIDNVSYEIPHGKVSAKKHLELQKKPKITIQFIGEHDVALLYVPKNLFKDASIDTLGVNNPTLSVKLMLEHNKELFGFKYVLIGQETLDLIKSYTLKEDTRLSGFHKIIKIAGLALGIETFYMLKTIDSALGAVDAGIPDEISKAKGRSEAVQIIWREADLQIQKIIKSETITRSLRNYIIPELLKSVSQS